MEINTITISEARQGLISGKFRAADLVQACLEQIKKHDRRIFSFITVSDSEAREAAQEADKLISSADNRKRLFEEKPLLGIPIAVKDVLSTRDLRTTASSKILENYTPVFDATVVARMRSAGAVVVGKTNSDTFAFGASTENSGYGVTHNPWDLDRVAGGSSGGSAAAVAADEAIFSLGTDTGGSIRLPASFCGVVGLKLTYGRASRYGLLSMASSFDTPGPLTKTVADAREIYTLLAGEDLKDATSSSVKKTYTKKKSINQLKIGLPTEYFDVGLDSGVRKTVLKAVDFFKDHGATIKTISLPKTEYGVATYYVLVPSEISSNLGRYDGTRFGKTRDFFEGEAKRRIIIGTFSLSSGYYDAYYKKASQVRALIMDEFETAFRDVDLIMGPVCPTPPFRIGERVNDPLAMYLSDVYTVTVNLAGLPSISVPAGFSDGLPVGLQIIGPQWSEELILDTAEAYEAATDWHKKKPNL